MPDIADLFVEPSAEQKTGQLLRDSLHGARAVMRSALENTEMLIWRNPFGLEPQAVFDLLGTNAGPLLALKAAVLPLLDAAFPGEVVDRLKPDGVTLTVNDDGTVTVSSVRSCFANREGSGGEKLR